MSTSITHRRHHRAAVVVTMLGLLGACGSDGEKAEDGDAGAIRIVRADVERAAPDASAATEAAAAVTALGTDVYAQVIADLAGNVTVSPYSLAVALAMTRAGAAGVTAEEMDAVLHSAGMADLDRAFGSLDGLLATRAGTFPAPDGATFELELSFANALWPQIDFPFEESYLERLGTNYDAGVHTVDYAADAEAARQAINGWVSEQTKERIPELLPQGVVDSLTRLVLTNAVYLNAPWLYPFAEEATADGPFTRLDGTAATVPMMTQTTDFRYGAGDGWQAIELPYAGGALAMTVLVPDAGRFAEVEAQLAPGLIADANASLAEQHVRLQLPKWELRTEAGLKEPLQRLGMVTAFSDAADFSPMSSADLAITDVLQEVFVSVDERGTEAAAATAVVIGETAAPAEPVALAVDRPFLYWIADQPTGAVLFLGRVLDPSG